MISVNNSKYIHLLPIFHTFQSISYCKLNHSQPADTMDFHVSTPSSGRDNQKLSKWIRSIVFSPFSQFINGLNIGFNQMKNSSFSLFIMIKVSVVLFPAKIYLFKIVNRNTRKGCEICSKLTMKILEGPQWFCLGVFIVNFGHISWPFIVFQWLTLNR